MTSIGLQALKFGLVGVANTALGLAVILASMSLLGLSPVLANVVGYAAGLCLSFYVNSRWTFGHRASAGTAARFTLAFGVSYLMNVAVLLIGLHVFEASAVTAQVFAVVTYSVVFFVLSKGFVYTNENNRSGPSSVES